MHRQKLESDPPLVAASMRALWYRAYREISQPGEVDRMQEARTM